MAFRIGQKVTLIDDEPFEQDRLDIAAGVVDPQFGIVYTIRKIEDHSDGAGLMFAEIRNPPQPYSDGFRETTFCASYFRLVVSTETGMAILTEILDRETIKDAKPILIGLVQ